MVELCTCIMLSAWRQLAGLDTHDNRMHVHVQVGQENKLTSGDPVRGGTAAGLEGLGSGLTGCVSDLTCCTGSGFTGFFLPVLRSSRYSRTSLSEGRGTQVIVHNILRLHTGQGSI